MAVDTTIVEISSQTYAVVALAGTWSNIQVQGNHQAEMYIIASGGTAPTTESGFILRTLDAITPNTWADGDVYMKMRQENQPTKAVVLTV